MQRLAAQMFYMNRQRSERSPGVRTSISMSLPFDHNLQKMRLNLKFTYPITWTPHQEVIIICHYQVSFFSCLMDGEANSESSRLVWLSKQATLDVSFLLSFRTSTPNGLWFSHSQRRIVANQWNMVNTFASSKKVVMTSGASRISKSLQPCLWNLWSLDVFPNRSPSTCGKLDSITNVL